MVRRLPAHMHASGLEISLLTLQKRHVTFIMNIATEAQTRGCAFSRETWLAVRMPLLHILVTHHESLLSAV